MLNSIFFFFFFKSQNSKQRKDAVIGTLWFTQQIQNNSLLPEHPRLLQKDENLETLSEKNIDICAFQETKKD